MRLRTRAPPVLAQMAWNGPRQVSTEMPLRHKCRLSSQGLKLVPQCNFDFSNICRRARGQATRSTSVPSLPTPHLYLCSLTIVIASPSYDPCAVSAAFRVFIHHVSFQTVWPCWCLVSHDPDLLQTNHTHPLIQQHQWLKVLCILVSAFLKTMMTVVLHQALDLSWV